MGLKVVVAQTAFAYSYRSATFTSLSSESSDTVPLLLPSSQSLLQTPTTPSPSPPPRHQLLPLPPLIKPFRLLASASTDPASPSRAELAKYQSERTGFNVVLATTLTGNGGGGKRTKGTVTAELVIPIEMNDNSGVARAVAQSVFRGSLRYPFDVKEIAERRHGAFEGTSVNMRLDPEETCFSFEASSAEGLLYFLPIFLDYVYDPMLSQGTFRKQVHDVDANGHVTGALYEQSQRLERVGYQIMTAGLHRALYGAKDPKRSSMFGTPLAILGMTNQDVHNFHQKFYVPQTSTLIISGPSTSFPPSFPTSLLNTLNFNSEVTFTSKNQALGPTPPGWKRPWFPPIPPILSPKTADVHVDIPAHESGNRVWVSWNGGEVQPWSTRPPFELKLLADYLLVGDEAPVVKGLVLDGEDGDEEALCASVDVDTDTNPSIFTIRMDAIRPGEETTIASRLKNILAAVAQGGVDMVRMRCVLKNLNKEVWRDPLETMVALACEDAVFGAADGCDLPDAVEQASLTTYLAMTSDDWTHLLSDLLVNAPSVTVIGHASTTVLADIEARDRAAEKADGGGRRLAAAVRNADAAKRGSDEQKGRYDETEQRLRRWIELINDKREEKGMPKVE